MAPFLISYAASEEAVESGREALDRWWSYPWYDASEDALRRIDVKDPWMLDWDWPNWSWPWSMSGWGSTLGWILWGLLAIALAVVIYLLARAYLRGGTLGDGATATDKDDEAADNRQRIESLPFPVVAARGDLLAAARHCRQRGEFGEAAKYLFSYQLVELDKHRLIRLTRGKTNRQYLREVSAGAPVRDALGRTMVVFEDYFFGGYVIPRDRFEVCWSELPRFEAQLAGRTA
ncbi:MAG: hypothetical protein JW809_15425 [Pirellulales bacterium]|nr:hypothetical protein [Pirellulales bacterium]